MQKIHLTTFIKAPRKKVWETMLGDKTYREWTAAFMPGSYYRGTWEKGSKMIFLGPDPKTGKEMGMSSRVAENRPYEFVSLEHQGVIIDGKEDPMNKLSKDWAGVHENYTFIDKDGGTELLIDMDVVESEKAMMEGMWKDGLKKLKALAEK